MTLTTIRIHLISKWLFVMAILVFGLLTVASLPRQNICQKRQLLVKHNNLAKSCGLKHPQVKRMTRIIGGKDAIAGQFPFAARIEYDGIHTCGCTIIHSRYLITAAHCLRDEQRLKSVQSMIIHIGDFFRDIRDKKDCSTEYRVKKIYTHPDYLTKFSDIGIIELEKPIKFGYYDKGYGSSGPICLKDDLDFGPGSVLRLAGWGDSRSRTKVLQFDDYQVIKCSDAMKELSYFGHSIICTKTDTRFKSDYKGDSGSGLFANVRTRTGKSFSVLIGIVNRGIRRVNGHERGSIFARVSSYKDWIQEITGQKLFNIKN